MQPRTFLVGITQPDRDGLAAYLEHTSQREFLKELDEWWLEKPNDPLCLVSFYAKLCYKSLVEGKNANVSKVRSIEDNLKATIKSGHGSVFEHVWLNFVTTGCSRVFTHELVRHRMGTAFSQTSGRYVAIDKIDLVLPPELSNQVITFRYDNGETRQMTARELVETEAAHLAGICQQLRDQLIKPDMDFAAKKRLTSAIRRLAPNGQDNEIGWSCNVRSLRHMIEMRTSLAAEWEIRQVFGQVYDIVLARWPLMLEGGATGELCDGVYEQKELAI